MKAKTLFPLILSLLLLLSLTGCRKPEATQPQEEPSVESEAETEEEADEEAALFPVTVTDQLGRTVTIEEEPETLVSGYYISTSLLIALGEEDKLVGVEAKADSRPLYSLSAPGLLELPSTGTAKDFDLEGCAALHPDLVILPAKLKDSIPALEELGLTVLAVNPEDQALFEEALALLAEATGSQERKDALMDFYAEKNAELAEALAGAEAPSVYMSGNSSFLSTAGPAMYQDSIIRAAGGSNVAKELTDDYWTEVSYEQILAWNPSYIILAADADFSPEDILADENLAGVQAVKNGNVYQMPGGIEAWDSPVPGSILGRLWLASVLHPENYPAELFRENTVTFYETFFGFTPQADPASEAEAA